MPERSISLPVADLGGREDAPPVLADPRKEKKERKKEGFELGDSDCASCYVNRDLSLSHSLLGPPDQ